MKRLKTDDLVITAFCATPLFIACAIVRFYIRAEMNCEAVGGIPIRVFAFLSFVECVRYRRALSARCYSGVASSAARLWRSRTRGPVASYNAA